MIVHTAVVAVVALMAFWWLAEDVNTQNIFAPKCARTQPLIDFVVPTFAFACRRLLTYAHNTVKTIC